MNRYFQSLGWEELQNINVNQKTWGDGYYGRERAFVGELYEQRNMLTTNAVARLLHSIIGGVAVSSTRSQQMMQLLKRDLTAAPAPLGKITKLPVFSVNHCLKMPKCGLRPVGPARCAMIVPTLKFPTRVPIFWWCSRKILPSLAIAAYCRLFPKPLPMPTKSEPWLPILKPLIDAG